VTRKRSLIVASLATVATIATVFALSLAVFVNPAHANVASTSASGASGLHHEIYMPVKGKAHAKPCRRNCGGNNLTYHGGVGGVGVETGADKVYLIYWGSQWNSNDPSGEAAIQQNFFNHVGGSSWNNSVTQYCEGVATGTITCGTSGTHATNPNNVLGGVWYDNASAAPTHPTQSQLAAEAVNAAAHFGNTTSSSNTTVQYVVNTATGNSMNGFGTQWCAWHSSTSSSYGNIAYTNMPYITDAGASCGANFVNGGTQGLTDGITIVGGHEFAETETDIFPNGGWLDGSGAENGDKCAWISSGQGASANITMNGATFPVQSLWSNAFNSNAGGCVQSY
jgi:serine protease